MMSISRVLVIVQLPDTENFKMMLTFNAKKTHQAVVILCLAINSQAIENAIADVFWRDFALTESASKGVMWDTWQRKLKRQPLGGIVCKSIEKIANREHNNIKNK